MKKVVSILILFVILVGLTFFINMLPSDNADISAKTAEALLLSDFSKLRQKSAEAGYEVRDSFVDAKFEGVVEAFSVKINFDANTVATIPIVLCESEDAAKYNCDILEGGIKLPIRNGCVFSYPGRDYPENAIAVIDAIVNGKEIPQNDFAK